VNVGSAKDEEPLDQDNQGPGTLLDRPFSLTFRYVNRNRQFHDVSAVITRVTFSRTNQGAPRITLRGRDEAHGPLKTYHFHRFCEIVDQTTGEILTDVVAAFSGILAHHGGTQPPDWPMVRVRRKSTLPFTGPDDSAVSWAFQVPAVFRAALDILWSQETRRISQPDGTTVTRVTWEGWTEGAPPALAFSQGDTFHAPATVGRMEWGRQVRAMTHMIQIQTARACSADDPTDSGEVTLALYTIENGTLGTPEIMTMTQVQCRDLLRDGVPVA